MINDALIAQTSPMFPVRQILQRLGLDERYADPYGHHKAKLNYDFFNDYSFSDPGKTVLFASLVPSHIHRDAVPCAIALTDALRRNGKKAVGTFSQPFPGVIFDPAHNVYGSGYAQLVPSGEISTHFTGDLYAFISALRYMCLLPERHIANGNLLKIDPENSPARIPFMNGFTKEEENSVHAAALKEVTPYLYSPIFMELLIAFNLSHDEDELIARLSRIHIATSVNNTPVTLGMLKGAEETARVMRQAFLPNIVQSIEGNPAIIHGIGLRKSGFSGASVVALSSARALCDIALTDGGAHMDGSLQRNLDIRFSDPADPVDRIVLVLSQTAIQEWHEKLNTPCGPGEYTYLDQLTGIFSFYKTKYRQLPLALIHRHKTDNPVLMEQLIRVLEEAQIPYSICSAAERAAQGATEAAAFIRESLLKHTAFSHPHQLTKDLKNAMINAVIDETGADEALLTEEVQNKLCEIEPTLPAGCILTLVPTVNTVYGSKVTITGIDHLMDKYLFIHCQ